MVGEAIRKRREQLGISQGTLAQRVDRDQSFISQIERRTTPGYLPDVDLMLKIAEALESPVSPFLQASGYLPPAEAEGIVPEESDPLADPDVRAIASVIGRLTDTQKNIMRQLIRDWVATHQAGA